MKLSLFNYTRNKFVNDPIYKNSLFLIASTAILSICGFIFWLVVARIYNAESVGIATSLISVTNLISGFSTLGLTISLIRFLPKSTRRNSVINSSFLATGIASIITSLLFLLGLKIFSPHLGFLTTNFFYIISFILFVIASTWNVMVESVFIAYRASHYILLKNSMISIVKLLLPFLFVFLGSYGIFSSVYLAMLLSFGFIVVVLIQKYHYIPSLSINTSVLIDMAQFSIGNYIAGFLYQAPALLLPLLIINLLGTKEAAYFYIDAMILNFLIVIPVAITQSLLTEGSYNTAELRAHFNKSITLIFILLIPSVLIIFLFGNIILHFFGSNYESYAFGLLRLLSLSALFTAISLTGSAVLRIHHKILTLITANLVGFLLTIGFCFVFVHLGLLGIGWGWLIGQICMGVLFLILLLREIYTK